MLSTPLWKVELEVQHGATTFCVSPLVRATNEAEARARAEQNTNEELDGLGTVIGIVTVERITA